MDKKNKNIVLLILSVPPVKVLIHFLIYTSKVQGIVSSKVIYHDLSYHINSIFIEKQWLFVPSIIAILIVAWFFGYFDKILLKNSVKEKLEKRIKELENVCKQKARKEKVPDTQISEEQQIKCNKCDYTTTLRQGLKIHCTKVHSKIDLGEFPAACNICEEKKLGELSF